MPQKFAPVFASPCVSQAAPSAEHGAVSQVSVKTSKEGQRTSPWHAPLSPSSEYIELAPLAREWTRASRALATALLSSAKHAAQKAGEGARHRVANLACPEGNCRIETPQVLLSAADSVGESARTTLHAVLESWDSAIHSEFKLSHYATKSRNLAEVSGLADLSRFSISSISRTKVLNLGRRYINSCQRGEGPTFESIWKYVSRTRQSSSASIAAWVPHNSHWQDATVAARRAVYTTLQNLDLQRRHAVVEAQEFWNSTISPKLRDSDVISVQRVASYMKNTCHTMVTTGFLERTAGLVGERLKCARLSLSSETSLGFLNGYFAQQAWSETVKPRMWQVQASTDAIFHNVLIPKARLAFWHCKTVLYSNFGPRLRNATLQSAAFMTEQVVPRIRNALSQGVRSASTALQNTGKLIKGSWILLSQVYAPRFGHYSWDCVMLASTFARDGFVNIAQPALITSFNFASNVGRAGTDITRNAIIAFATSVELKLRKVIVSFGNVIAEPVLRIVDEAIDNISLLLKPAWYRVRSITSSIFWIAKMATILGCGLASLYLSSALISILSSIAKMSSNVAEFWKNIWRFFGAISVNRQGSKLQPGLRSSLSTQKETSSEKGASSHDSNAEISGSCPSIGMDDHASVFHSVKKPRSSPTVRRRSARQKIPGRSARIGGAFNLEANAENKECTSITTRKSDGIQTAGAAAPRVGSKQLRTRSASRTPVPDEEEVASELPTNFSEVGLPNLSKLAAPVDKDETTRSSILSASKTGRDSCLSSFQTMRRINEVGSLPNHAMQHGTSASSSELNSSRLQRSTKLLPCQTIPFEQVRAALPAATTRYEHTANTPPTSVVESVASTVPMQRPLRNVEGNTGDADDDVIIVKSTTRRFVDVRLVYDNSTAENHRDAASRTPGRRLSTKAVSPWKSRIPRPTRRAGMITKIRQTNSNFLSHRESITPIVIDD
jgi:hypothetical protein